MARKKANSRGRAPDVLLGHGSVVEIIRCRVGFLTTRGLATTTRSDRKSQTLVKTEEQNECKQVLSCGLCRLLWILIVKLPRG